MKRIQIIIFVIFFCLFKLYAQNDSSYVDRHYLEKETLWDRIYVGGNFGLQLGTVTFFDISPLIGYKITDRFSAGVGITYQYLNYKGLGVSYKAHTVGGRVFGRYLINHFLFAHAEYENLNLPIYNNSIGEYRREWVPGLLIGGGITQSIGQRASFNLTLLYNLLYDDNKSPYSGPLVIRIGFFL
jgi:long-subunit fatty acid transport protein